MSKKNNNPYRDGSAYHAIFAAIKEAKGIVTRQGLIDAGFSKHDVQVVLSPRAESRGNLSARSEVYFMDKLNKKKGEDQRFRLRFHKTPLDKLTRKSAKSEGVESTQTKAKSKAKTKKAATVEA